MEELKKYSELFDELESAKKEIKEIRGDVKKNADFIARLEVAVEEIEKLMTDESVESLTDWETGNDVAVNQTLNIIHAAFPELKNVQRPKSES